MENDHLTEATSDYPHQRDEDGTVTFAQLREDFEANPDKYDALLHPYIERHLFSEAAVADTVELAEQAPPARTAEEVLALIDAGDTTLTDEDAQCLIQAGQAEEVMGNLGRFQDLSFETALSFKGLDDYGLMLAEWAEYFRTEDHDKIMNFLLDEEWDIIIRIHGTAFKQLHPPTLARLHSRWDHMDFVFPSEPTVDDYREFIFQLKSGPVMRVVLASLDQFPVEARRMLGFRYLEEEGYYAFIPYREAFSDIADAEITEQINTAVNELRANGLEWEIARYLERFPGVNHLELARGLVRNRHFSVLARYFSKFEVDHALFASELTEEALAVLAPALTDIADKTEIVCRIMTNPRALDILKVDDIADSVDWQSDTLKGITQDFSAYMSRIVTDKQLSAYINLASHVPGYTLPDTLQCQQEVFGECSSVDVARLIDEILHETYLPVDAEELGVTRLGREGIAQLKAYVADVPRLIKRGMIDESMEKKFEHSIILRSLLRRATEYNDNSYGSSSDGSLHRKLKYHNQAVEDGRIAPMPPEYVPSEIYTIKTADSDKERPEWSPDVVERYEALRVDIFAAKAIVSEQFGFGRAVAQLRAESDVVCHIIEQQLAKIDPADPQSDMKRRNLENRYQALAAYIAELDTGDSKENRFVMESAADVRRGFSVLAQYDELHPAMRQVFFAWAMRRNPEQAAAVADLSEEPTIDDIAAVREFIEHIVNQETFGSYFTDKKQAGTFKRMSSTKALEEAMVRSNNLQQKGKTTELQFIPSRGILLELSGQIANACWADMNKSVAEDMPNMTAAIMRARPGKKDERFVGAALLMETTNVETGKGVLVLRGTNPRENYINKVDVAEFYEAITSYVTQLAEARGLEPAIVIDDHSGGSGTNRPVLHNYLYRLTQTLPPVTVDVHDTYFNEYDVSRQCYRL